MSSYFVDPSIDADTGAGTIGDPYGDLQHCLDTITRNGTTGDKINIKSGTAEVLTAPIDVSTYGAPAYAAGLSFVGYDAVEDDGGVAEIDGDGGAIWSHSSYEGISFKDLKLGNCGSSTVLNMDRFCAVIHCEVHTTTGDGVYMTSTGPAAVESCWFHNIGGTGVKGLIQASDCLFTNGPDNNFYAGVEGTSAAEFICTRCCFLLSGASAGMVGYSATRSTITHNSLLTTGTGSAITGFRAIYMGQLTANLIEGFSDGITLYSGAESHSGPMAHNVFYDISGTEVGVSENAWIHHDNQTALASLFEKTGSINSMADRFAYFQPVDQNGVFNFRGGLCKGAIQPVGGGGGASLPDLKRGNRLAQQGIRL